MTSINARPAEAAGRQVPGHWEGDLVIGKAGKTALASLVERTRRYLAVVALPEGKRDAATTCDSLIGAVKDMPAQLLKTLTWDSHDGPVPGLAPGLTRPGTGVVPCRGSVGPVFYDGPSGHLIVLTSHEA